MNKYRSNSDVHWLTALWPFQIKLSMARYAGRALWGYALLGVAVLGSVLTVLWRLTARPRLRVPEGVSSLGNSHKSHRDAAVSQNLTVEPITSTVAAPSVEERSSIDLGRFPLLTLTTAIGLLLVAFAYLGGHTEAAGADLLFWLGMLTIFIPCASRIISSGPNRTERIALIILLGMGLYLVKVLHSPVGFTHADEFDHWRAASDILHTQQLFSTNPLLPISPSYPGLAIVETAVMSVTGLDTFAAGVIVIGVARLVLMLAVFLAFERLTGAPRTAGIATLIFTANPGFVFFSALVVYESLGTAITVVAILATVEYTRGSGDLRMLAIAVVATGTVIVTHHLTSYALLTLLILWAVIDAVIRRNLASGPAPIALAGAGMVIAWLLVTDSIFDYLVTPLVATANETMSILVGDMSFRNVFEKYSGPVVPLWERVVATAGVVLVLLGLPLGIWRIWIFHRSNAPVFLLGIVALAYPIPVALRFLMHGTEIGARAAPYVFFAVSLVLALTLVLLIPATHSPRRLALVVTMVTVLFVSGVLQGQTGGWARLPGPYLVSAHTRSVEPQAIYVSVWARDELGPGNRYATDQQNRQRIGSQGEQTPVSHFADGVEVSPLFFSLEFGSEEAELIKQGRVEYLFVDRRLSTGLPMVGFYIDPGEENAFQHEEPIPLTALTKFDDLPGISKIFDTKDISLYDVRAIANETR
jgi:hypothetical protein